MTSSVDDVWTICRGDLFMSSFINILVNNLYLTPKLAIVGSIMTFLEKRTFKKFHPVFSEEM